MLNAVVEIVMNTTRTSGVPETDRPTFAYRSERNDKLVSWFRTVLATALLHEAVPSCITLAE
jgi:hypothetical protein